MFAQEQCNLETIASLMLQNKMNSNQLLKSKTEMNSDFKREINLFFFIKA